MIGGPCERCGKTPDTSDTDYATWDYCVHCSMDLCPKCMTESMCRESEDGLHETTDYDE